MVQHHYLNLLDPVELLIIRNKTSPYSPIFGEFLNRGNTSLIGEPVEWEGA